MSPELNCSLTYLDEEGEALILRCSRRGKTLQPRSEESGATHTVEFNGQNFASGVYFYRLTAPGVIQVKKMLMIK